MRPQRQTEDGAAERNDDHAPEAGQGQLASPVGRAFRMVRFIAEGGSTANLSELSRQLDINRITATRLLATLEQEGIIERLPQGGHRIGIGFLSLAATTLASDDLFGHGRRVLAGVCEALQLSAYLVIPDGIDVLYMLRVMPETPLVSNIRIGSRLGIHLTTPGRVLLAHQPQVLRALLQAQPELAAGKRRASLEAALADARERGCAWSFSGFEPGIDACAAPVYDAPGHAIAAISVAGPTVRFEGNPSFQRKTEKTVKEAAHRLSLIMGLIPTT